MWKYQTGNQILQSAAYQPEDDGIATTTEGTLYFASNDGYAYALDAGTGGLVWQSDADPRTAGKDKFPSMGFYSWWPVIYGNYVIFTSTGFYASNGAEAFWLFCPPGSIPTSCTSIQDGVNPGVLGNETQSGYWMVGEKTLNSEPIPMEGPSQIILKHTQMITTSQKNALTPAHAQPLASSRPKRAHLRVVSPALSACWAIVLHPRRAGFGRARVFVSV